MVFTKIFGSLAILGLGSLIPYSCSEGGKLNPSTQNPEPNRQPPIVIIKDKGGLLEQDPLSKPVGEGIYIDSIEDDLLPPPLEDHIVEMDDPDMLVSLFVFGGFLLISSLKKEAP